MLASQLQQAAATAEADWSDLQSRIKEADSRLAALYRKQGSSSYRSRDERDAELKKQVKRGGSGRLNERARGSG